MPKISELTAAAARTGTETVAVVQSGVSRKMVLRMVGHNVLDYGAAGDSNTTTLGAGTDDTAAFQAAINAAVAVGGMGSVIVPGNRTYRITSTLTIPVGIHITGIPGRRGNAAGGVPVLAWHGTGGGTVLSCTTGTQNLPGVLIEHLGINGVGSIYTAAGRAQWPGIGIRYASTAWPSYSGATAAKPDSGTGLVNVWFGLINGDAIVFDTHGITNMYIRDGRWDQIYGYAISLNGGNSFLQIRDCTYDNWVASDSASWTTNGGEGFVPGGNGFLYYRGETLGSGHILHLDVSGFHSENNGSLRVTDGAGVANAQRGLFRIGVNPASTVKQANITFTNIWAAKATSSDPFSYVQITGGTETQNASLVQFSMRGARIGVTNGGVDIVGGVPAAHRISTGTRNNFLAVDWGPLHPNASEQSYTWNETAAGSAL